MAMSDAPDRGRRSRAVHRAWRRIRSGFALGAATGPEGRRTVAVGAGRGSPPQQAPCRKEEAGAYHEEHRRGAYGRREERPVG